MGRSLPLVEALKDSYEVSVGTFDGDDLFVCHIK